MSLFSAVNRTTIPRLSSLWSTCSTACGMPTVSPGSYQHVDLNVND